MAGFGMRAGDRGIGANVAAYAPAGVATPLDARMCAATTHRCR